MQRIALKMKMWQALLSMFMASMAALLISAAPAYADDNTDANPAPAQETAMVQTLTAEEQQQLTGATATGSLETVDAAEDGVGNAESASAETLVKNEADGAETAIQASETKADGTSAVAGSDTTKADAGIYSITQNGSYTLTGTGYTGIEISGAEANDVTLNLIDAIIDARGTGNSAISIINGAIAKLNIFGACELIGDVNQAGIQVDGDSELIINGDASATSSLKAVGNGGVDYSSNAEKRANNSSSGAGIGGTKASADSGKITIDGAGRNLTLSAIGGGEGGSGIGAAWGGVSDEIRINSAVLQTIHGGGQNADIEGSQWYRAKDTLEGGCGIGGGTKGQTAGLIAITDCYGRDIVGGGKSAGIGGGCWAYNTTVEIDSSDLEVYGGTAACAIGAGRGQNGVSFNVSIVNGSTIRAYGGYLGAGIGFGFSNNYKLAPSLVYISDSDVFAAGGAGAAGIGGGARGFNVSVSIVDGSNVQAYAGASYADTTKSYADLLNVKAGDIGQGGAAGIGRGAWGSVNFQTQHADDPENAKLVISADSSVLAMSSGDNWAVAGFTDVEGVAATILQTRFSRNYDLKDAEDFDTQKLDLAKGDGWAVCFLDGKSSTNLSIVTADGATLAASFATPELYKGTTSTQYTGNPFLDNGGFDNKYTGNGRLGYYSFAVTVPEAGDYTISTDSTVRSITNADGTGDDELNVGDEGYLGGATYWTDDAADRNNVFTVAAGLNSFDKVAFRAEAAPIPVPEPVPDPEPEPTPDPAPDPEPAPAPDPTPDPEPDPIAESDPVPESDPAPVETVITDDPVPAAAIGVVADGPAAAVAEAIVADVIADAETPLADAETIADEETPLAGIFDEDEDCWVHWWIMLGILITAVYSSVVIARRKKHSHDVFSIDKDIMDENYEQERVNVPSVNLGAQPAMSASAEA